MIDKFLTNNWWSFRKAEWDNIFQQIKQHCGINFIWLRSWKIENPNKSVQLLQLSSLPNLVTESTLLQRLIVHERPNQKILFFTLYFKSVDRYSWMVDSVYQWNSCWYITTSHLHIFILHLLNSPYFLYPLLLTNSYHLLLLIYSLLFHLLTYFILHLLLLIFTLFPMAPLTRLNSLCNLRSSFLITLTLFQF